MKTAITVVAAIFVTVMMFIMGLMICNVKTVSEKDIISYSRQPQSYIPQFFIRSYGSWSFAERSVDSIDNESTGYTIVVRPERDIHHIYNTIKIPNMTIWEKNK